MENPAALLRRLFDRAVEVADPMQSLSAHLPPRPPGRKLTGEPADMARELVRILRDEEKVI